MAETTGDKSEKPTPKRIKDARKRGQVASSRDLSMAVGSLAATGVLVASGGYLLHRLSSAVVESLRHLGDQPLRDVGMQDLTPVVLSGLTLLAITAGPVAVAAAATGTLSAVVQTGFNVSTEPLKPNWERLSPVNGFKKFAPSRAGVDTLKAIITAIVLGVLAWKVGLALALDSNRMVWTGPVASAARGWDESLKLMWQAGFALLALGGFDLGLQKWRLHQQLRMTRQEVRDDAKHNETNPEVKARVRRIQRDMARKRMFQAIPRATVVLTNPTHFAVALEYNRDKNAAPVIVAKGADLIALRIREIARDHSVPIVENPVLTRALYKECEIGDTIPGPLFGAVAEVLAYLVRIKQLVL